MQEQRRSIGQMQAPTIDIEKREALLGVIVQSPTSYENPAGTGQTPVIVRAIGDVPDNNPYAQRGFKRGNDEKPTINTFLCCYSLNSGVLFTTICDVAQAFFWFTMTLVSFGTLECPFYLLYLGICFCRLYYFWQFNKEDTEQTRCNLYKCHLFSAVSLAILYFLQFVVTYIHTGSFPGLLFVWGIMSTISSAYLIVLHRQNWRNFEIDHLRASAYEQAKIDNSGVICAEDLLLKDGTRAWANQGGETKIFDP